MSERIEARRFEQSDNVLDFGAHGRIDIVTLSDGTQGMHAILEPGYVWSVDEKPLLGNPDSCPMAHTGYCVSGELDVEMMDSGEHRRLRAGDFFEIPAGHDAHVIGDARCELILFAAPTADAVTKPPPEEGFERLHDLYDLDTDNSDERPYGG